MAPVFSQAGRKMYDDYEMEDRSKSTFNSIDLETQIEKLIIELKKRDEVIEDQRKKLDDKDRIIEELRLKYEDDEPVICRKVGQGGRPIKPWEDLTGRQKGRSTQDLQDHVLAKAEERNIQPLQLSGYLLHR